MFPLTGLTPPAAVQSATAQYQRDSDEISRFVEEMLVSELGSEVRTEEAYRADQDWCTRNGQAAEGMARPFQKFAADMCCGAMASKSCLISENRDLRNIHLSYHGTGGWS